MLRIVFVSVFACLASLAQAQTATSEQKAQLAPAGALRAAVVTIPFLAKLDASGQTIGVAPDLAAEMAKLLGVKYEPTAFKSPNEGIAAVRAGKADLTFLAPTPERNALLDFSTPFMQMEITLVVAGDSPIKTLADADQPGRKIVVYEKTANEQTARKAMTKATFLTVPLFAYKKAFEMIKAGEADAFVDLTDQLASHQPDFPGSRLIPGAIGRNDMAIGIAKERPAAVAFVKDFTAVMVKSGFITKAIERAGVRGAVAPGS